MSMDPVDGAELDGLEGWVLGAVDGGAHFLFPSWSVGLFCWYKNAPWGLDWRKPQGGVGSVVLCGCSWAAGSVGQLGLDAVDQPSQRDVDPARRLLSFEVYDVVRALGDDVACQLEGLRNV